MGWLQVLLGAAGVLVTLVVVVLLVERLANARRPEPGDGGDSAGSGMFGELVEIFQPSRVHLTQERERQRLDIAQTPAEGAPFGVGLDAGVAYLPAPATRRGRTTTARPRVGPRRRRERAGRSGPRAVDQASAFSDEIIQACFSRSVMISCSRSAVVGSSASTSSCTSRATSTVCATRSTIASTVSSTDTSPAG